MRKLKNLVIILLLVVVVGLSSYLYVTKNTVSGSTVTTQLVEEQIAMLGELATARYNYTNVVAWEDNIKFRNMTLPFTTKSFMLMYTGYVKAGVDLEAISVAIDPEQAIEIVLPQPRVTDSVLNEDDVYIYDQSSALFNKLDFEDLYSVLPNEKQRMEMEAVERGLLLQAATQAEALIAAFLGNLGFTEIEITYSQGE
ncbi:MAG: DUF4230 domain-containing protein [Firmicutes bacterium]|nr:DUF4230 domain-containing protein [Bacillota bacterium]